MFSVEGANLTGGVDTTSMDASGFSGAVILHSGGGNDTLSGGSGDNTLYGGSGTDTLIAGSARADGDSNVLQGGGGMSVLVGGSGNETMIAGSSTTIMLGGSGQNHFVVDNPTGTLLAPIGGIDVIGGAGTVNTLTLENGGGSGFVEAYTINPSPPSPGSDAIATTSLIDLTVPQILASVQFNAAITTVSPGNNVTPPLTQEIQVAGLSSITDSVAVSTLSIVASPAAGSLAIGTGTIPRPARWI